MSVTADENSRKIQGKLEENSRKARGKLEENLRGFQVQVGHLPEKGSCGRDFMCRVVLQRPAPRTTHQTKTTKDAQKGAGLMRYVFRVTKPDSTTTVWEQPFYFCSLTRGVLACCRETSHRPGSSKKKVLRVRCLTRVRSRGGVFVSPGRDTGPAASTARTKETQQPVSNDTPT